MNEAEAEYWAGQDYHSELYASELADLALEGEQNKPEEEGK